MGRQRSTAKGGTERSGIEDERGTGWIEREERERARRPRVASWSGEERGRNAW